MHRKEINERSPLRVLESSIHGGLGRGNIGVVIARHGIGKTAFLIGVGLDDLMRSRTVLHVTLQHSIERLSDYYEEIFMELAHSQNLQDVWKVRLEVERHRRIHSYLKQEFTIGKLREALDFKEKYTNFVPQAIMIDGLDFDGLTPDDLVELRAVARERNAEIWLSAVTTRDAERDERGIPEPVASLQSGLDVILTMAHDGEGVHVGLLKDHDSADVSDLKLNLDPTTMLLVTQ